MTSGQRIMLTAASNSAKTVADYDNAEKTELDALRAATAEAERILASESVITYGTANAALKTLNAELKKAGKPEVTEYNTVAYQVPVGSEQFEIAYESDANVIMYAYDNCDDAELSAVVLTQNGVLCTTTKKVNFYHPAYEGFSSQLTVIDRDSNEDGFTLWIDSDGDGVKDKEQTTYTYKDENEEDVDTYLDGNLAVNTKGTISVSFSDTSWNENNSVTVTKRYHHDEHIQFVTWSTSDSTIAKVDPDMNDPTTATVTAQKEGLVDILVTVKTEEGRTRTYSRTIYVYTIPKAPAQQPTP